MALVRSISGLRATLGDDLTPDLIVKYCSALANILPYGKIIIGRDGRQSGKWVENICVGTLSACGREIVILGIVPTPTVQLFVELSNAVAGIAITASHNPDQWNGLKFINSSGTFFSAEENQKLWNKLDSAKFEYQTNTNFARKFKDSLGNEKHIEQVLHTQLFTEKRIKAIKDRHYKVVVDAVNASGSIPVPLLLKELNCEVVELFCDNSGIFPHTPEPLPQNLLQLAEAVKFHKADIGIAVDPDADRLVLIDEKGRAVGEEKTVCLAIESVLSDYEQFSSNFDKSCVVNHSTTMTVDYIANKFGAQVFRSAVGEINVVNKMKETNAVIGGEGSGGVILPECHYGRDSLVGIALVLSLLANKKKILSQAVAEYPDYKMIKTKMPFSGDLEKYLDIIRKEFAGNNIINEDGIKIICDEGWVQLRKSNTEPIIRIIAEAEFEDIAEALIDKIAKIVNN